MENIMKHKQTLYYNSAIKSPAGAANYLRELADKIESKTLNFENDTPLSLELPEVLEIDLELKEKEKKGQKSKKLEVEIKWFE